MIEEFDLFSFSTPKFKIDKPIRLIELFAGIGSQAQALKNLGANFEHWKAIEIDKYAMASYNAIHGTNFDTQDIKSIHASDLQITDTDDYCYILTYSFPCQDLSLAGNQKGMSKGEGTRSGLLWEVERILDECEHLPQVLLMENVPQVIGKKNIADFQLWRRKLESLGYSNYVELLNSKDHGIPQNRNRCFMVSLLGDWSYTFPRKRKLELKLKDMLEETVDEKYYLSDEMIKYFVANNDKQKDKGNGFKFEPFERERESRNDNVRLSQDKTDRHNAERIGYVDKGTGEHQSNQVYDENGLSRTMQHTDYKDPMLVRTGGGSSIKEQVNTNQTKSTQSMETQELSMRTITSTQSKLSKTIRSGGRGSIDRHSWDIINEDN